MRGAVRLSAAVLLVAACASSCTSSDRSTVAPTTTTTTAPPPPTGVLVPGGAITISALDAHVDASSDGEAFQVTTSNRGESLTFVSEEGTQLSADTMPIRCGDAARAPTQPTLEEATKVSGSAAHLAISTDGGMVAITTVNPSMFAARPERVGGFPEAELTSSVLVSSEMALKLARQPADSPLTVQHWTHEFAPGASVDAELRGTLARELSYVFRFGGSGKPSGSSTDISGLPCNRQSVITNSTPGTMYGLVLLAGGTSLRLDGKRVADAQPDTAMQGSWAMATVTAAAKTAKVEVVDRSGKVVEHWTMTYDDGED